MGLLDYLFGGDVSPEAAHKAALRTFLDTASEGSAGASQPAIGAGTSSSGTISSSASIPTLADVYGFLSQPRGPAQSMFAPEPQTPNEYYPQPYAPSAPGTAGVSAPWAATTVQTPQAPNPWQTSVEPSQPLPGSMAPAIPQQAASAVQPGPGPASVSPQAPGPAPQPPNAQFQPGFFDRLEAFANAPNMFGGVAAAAGARDPATMEGMNATYQALISKGVSPDMARAAALNPQFGAQVMAHMFPELADVGVDRWGNSIKAWANPLDQSAKPVTMSGGADQSSSAGGVGTMEGIAHLVQSAKQMGIQPIEVLRKVDPITAGDVQAMIEGRTPISARASKQQDMLMSVARMIDPGFDASTYATRQKLRTEFTADGKDGQTIESAGQAIQHLHELSDMGSALHNIGGAGPLNAPLNYVMRGWRGMTQDQRTASFNTMKELAIKEVDKFYSGSGGGSAAEREELNSNINSASSPQQINSVIAHLTEAMGGKLQELDRKWRVGMGPSVAPYPVLSDESKQRINELQTRAGGRPTYGQATEQAPPGQREAIEAEMKRRGLL